MTLTELLVVLAILSLLATIAVPVFVSKTEQARRATARAEVRAIADAEELVALTHGFYVPMHLLDNLPPETSPSASARDGIDNHADAGSVRLVDPFRAAEDQTGGQPTLSTTTGAYGPRVVNMINNWSGPFLNPTRVYTGGNTSGNLNDLTDAERSRDLILDPWGNPYRFYSSIGVVSSQAANDNTIGANALNVDDGLLTTDEDRFDRWAVVSYGTNGVVDGTGSFLDDDIYYTFGVNANESVFNNL